jgi:hypothetical protein
VDLGLIYQLQEQRTVAFAADGDRPWGIALSRETCSACITCAYGLHVLHGRTHAMVARSNFSSFERCLNAVDGCQDMRQLCFSKAADVTMLKLAAQEGWVHSMSSRVQTAWQSAMSAVRRKPIQADELAGVCSRCLAWVSHKTPDACLDEVQPVADEMGGSSANIADCLQCLASKDPVDVAGIGGVVSWLRGRARYQMTCILLNASTPTPPVLHVAALPLHRQQQLQLLGFELLSTSGANDTVAAYSSFSIASGEHVLLGAKDVQYLRKLVYVYMGRLVNLNRVPGFGEIRPLQHLWPKLCFFAFFVFRWAFKFQSDAEVRRLKLGWGDSGRMFDIVVYDDIDAAYNDSSSWSKLRQAVPGCLLWIALLVVCDSFYFQEPIVAGLFDHMFCTGPL